MSVSSIYSGNTRLSGMYSGLDTESLVTNSLASEQSRLDKLYQDKQIEEWKYEAYAEINTAVSELRNSYLSVLGENSLMKSAAYQNFKVNMAENAAIKITGTSSALETNFTILSTSMATSATAANQLDTNQTELVSQSLLRAAASGSLGAAVSESTTIGDLAERFGLGERESLSFSINGESFTFSQETTLEEMAAAINESETAAATMEIDYATGAVSLRSDKLGADSALTLSNITGTAFSADAGLGIAEGKAKRTSILSSPETTSFSELAAAMGADFTEGSISINGVEFEIGADESIARVMERVNVSDAGVTMRFDAMTGRFTLRNKADRDANTAENAGIEVSGALFGEDGVFGVETGTYRDNGSVVRSDTLAEVARKLGVEVGETLSFTINGVDFSFDTATDTISDVMNAVNNDPDANAQFSYSELTDSFSIRSADTGSAAALEISGMETLFGLGADAVQGGTDATLTVSSGGVTRTIVQAENDFTLDGLSFEITGSATFENGLAVNVEQDYQPTIDAVKDFIEAYNGLIEKLNTYYYEEKYRDYEPLTEEQRAELTEDEAAKWDEKAKSGILRNDSTIGNLLTSLRSSLSATVGDTGMSAYDLGITTVAWETGTWRTNQGKLQLDEDQLLAALKENSNAVQEVMMRISDETETVSSGTSTTSESGLLVRMNAALSGFNSTMRAENLQNTKDYISDYEEKIAEQLEKMAEKEERLWAKYSALETALSELQSQSDYITSLFGTSSSS